MTEPSQPSWKSLASVVAGALFVLVALEAFFWTLHPPHPLRQVDQALADLERVDPDILVMSSSHGRSFHVLGQELERLSGGNVRTVAVPLEGGHMRAMGWVLANRVGPILDRKPQRSRDL